jgi:hypothetical protein
MTLSRACFLLHCHHGTAMVQPSGGLAGPDEMRLNKSRKTSLDVWKKGTICGEEGKGVPSQK